VLLILCCATFSGIATTVSALEHPERVDACCEREKSAPEPTSDPCEDADCFCFACLVLDVTTSCAASCPLQFTASVFSPSLSFCPDGYGGAIDYPPETA
jgi:hypothetical protein